MRLIDSRTNQPIPEGDIVQLNGKDYYVSGLVPKKGTIFLFSDSDDRSPFPVKPAAVGAAFRR